MKRYVLGLLLGLLSFPIIWTALVIYPHRAPRGVRDDYNLLDNKLRIAKSHSKPQILFLGGSNTFYGLSAKILDQEYHIPATNLAVQAGFTRRYMLQTCVRVVKPGDLVILSLEYELYNVECYSNPALYFRLLTSDKEYFYSLPWSVKIKLLASVPPFGWARLLIEDLFRSQDKHWGSMNENGDQTSNLTTGVYNEDTHHFDFLRRFQLDPSALVDLKEFHQQLVDRGARAIIVFPNYFENTLDEKANADFIRQVKNSTEVTGIQVVGNPSDRFFKADVYFDNRYHQTFAGQIRTTHRLMQELSEAGIELPH